MNNSDIEQLAAGQIRSDTFGGTITVQWVDYVRGKVAVTYPGSPEVHVYSVGTILELYPQVAGQWALAIERRGSARR